MIDIAIISILANQFNFTFDNLVSFITFAAVAWLILPQKTKFYDVYRYTKVVQIISRVLLQAVIFTFIVFTFFGIYQDIYVPNATIIVYLIQVFSLILIFKLMIYFLLQLYRSVLKGNYRRAIIVGKTSRTEQLKDFFIRNPEYGYRVSKVFDVKEIKGDVNEELFWYILNNDIDEIYCSTSELANQQINELINFADNNLKVLKFLPDSNDIYSKRLKYDYYGYLPILSLREIPIKGPLNQVLKRGFDIVFSFFVLLFLLSWLTPLLAILIKIDSKGPVFFKQKRNGLDYKEFYCYKFRSMKPNPKADLKQVSRNDQRITWIGRILRRTSCDELPQFLNVLKGEMSVVGPRPHMVNQTEALAEGIDKFMVRHFVKPGITGLAQVSGYRGEIDSEQHIINRVKYDVFYVENWSLILDFKIIGKTIYNAIKGDENAV